MGRVRFRGRDWVKSIFLDRDLDPGTCPTWQNCSNRIPSHQNPQTSMFKTDSDEIIFYQRKQYYG